MDKLLKDDYNLEALAPVQPAGDDFTMLVTPRFHDSYASGYETLSTRVSRQFMLRRSLFIDVGAHYGYYSLLAGTSNPDIRIVSVEPIAENYTVLRRNLENNGISADRSKTINAAVSNKAGHVRFCKSEASDNGSIYRHPKSGTLECINVRTVCLDDVVTEEQAQGKPIFVKTDTDGHELAVLKGFAKTLESDADVAILMEINPKMMKIAGTCTREILDFLEARGFRVFAIDDQRSKFLPLDLPCNVTLMESLYSTSYYNVLCVRKRSSLSVLFFSHSHLLGGAERSLVDLIGGLTARGVVCTAMLPSDGPLGEALVAEGCAVCAPAPGLLDLAAWRWGDFGCKPNRSTFVRAQDIVVSRLFPEIQRIVPDVIMSQTIVSPWGTWCAESLGIPHVLSVREYGKLDHNLEFLMDFEKSVAALRASSDQVLSITEDVRKTLFGDSRDGNMETVYGSIRLPKDAIANVKNSSADIPSASAKPTIGMFATITEGKGQLDLVNACVALARDGIKFKCILAGSVADDLYASKLRKTIEGSGFADRFEMPGYVSDPYATMSECSVLVSCSRHEALGRTIMEAALLKVPVVYANAGGSPEILKDGEHALSYPPGNSDELANSIRKLLEDKSAAAAMAQKAHEHVVRNFNDDTYAGRVLNRLKAAASAKGGAIAAAGRAVSHLMVENGLGSEPQRLVNPKLYYCEANSGFHESKIILLPDVPIGPFRLVFNLPYEHKFRLRFDPTGMYDITLAVHSITAMDSSGKQLADGMITYTTNGVAKSDNEWMFPTMDPQVLINLQGKATRLVIYGEIRLAEPENLNSLISDLDAKIEDERKHNVLRDARIKKMEQSTSWRVTQLLRNLSARWQ